MDRLQGTGYRTGEVEGGPSGDAQSEDELLLDDELAESELDEELEDELLEELDEEDDEEDEPDLEP